MNNIVIGKHALESLTTGMYSDPMVVFREYIQNSVDSIDSAVEKGIIARNEGYVDICISALEQTIVIMDNGLGIDEDDAERTLISIGNSKKSSNISRGFRGIGRLAALGYCDELVFETSVKGSKKGVRLTINSKRLTEHLLFEDEKEMSAEEVLADVYTCEEILEAEKTHYFKVIMRGIEQDADIMQEEQVFSYISQNAPVPYNDEHFAWGKEIRNRLCAEGYVIPEYTIFLNFGGIKKQIFKPCTDSFTIDKGKNIKDSISDIEIIKFESSESSMAAIGWLATSGYLGSIYDKNVKGIRIRKGNIMIGDAQTLNSAFKDSRFNGWCLGEIFTLDQRLIPNARRDNFEKNSSYYLLWEQLQNLAFNTTKKIRTVSMQRNQAVSTDEELVTPVQKESATSKRNLLKKELLRTKKRIDEVELEKDTGTSEINFKALDALIDVIEGSPHYKVLNTLALSNNEKRVLEKVFNTIIAVDDKRAEELIDAILRVFM